LSPIRSSRLTTKYSLPPHFCIMTHDSSPAQTPNPHRAYEMRRQRTILVREQLFAPSLRHNGDSGACRTKTVSRLPLYQIDYTGVLPSLSSHNCRTFAAPNRCHCLLRWQSFLAASVDQMSTPALGQYCPLFLSDVIKKHQCRVMRLYRCHECKPLCQCNCFLHVPQPASSIKLLS
jgi:hypothetical protein